jgi:hypothetical protein
MTRPDKGARFAALRAKIQATSPGTFSGKKDREDFWLPSNGETTVRLLQHPSDEQAVVNYWNHALQIKEKWFIDDCPMAINQPCPICEAGLERMEYHVANVFAPEAGAVLWWKFGVQIAKKIIGAEDAGIDPFDPRAGADLVVRKPDYHNSTFLPPSSLGTEEEIAAILAKCKPLSTVLKLKSYVALKAKYEQMTAGAK